MSCNEHRRAAVAGSMRHLSLATLLVFACDSTEHAPKVDRAVAQAQDALDKAEKGVRKGYNKAEKGVRKGYDKAEKGVRKGYDKARERVEAVDWVQALDDTKATVEHAKDAIRADKNNGTKEGKPPKDAWWTRGSQAVRCDESGETCTVAAWFVTAARDSPTKMMGDVEVFTALDDSGWLLGKVDPKSAAYAMGFREGDVVRSVAGRALTDGWARVKMLEDLRHAPRVDVVYVPAEQTEPRTRTVVFETSP